MNEIHKFKPNFLRGLVPVLPVSVFSSSLVMTFHLLVLVELWHNNLLVLSIV